MTARRVTARWYPRTVAGTWSATGDASSVSGPTGAAVLFDGPLLSIGRFWCPPGDERWTRENWIGRRAHVVFPHTAVLIRQRDREPLVADPTQAVLYETGTHYQRDLLSPEGDRSTYVAAAPAALAAIAASFPTTNLHVTPSVALGAQLLARCCEDPAGPDALEVEELGLSLIERSLAVAPSRADAERARRPMTDRLHADLVDDVRCHLAATSTDSQSLAEIAATVGASPFHLARLFRARTGLTLHEYRNQLRVRAALERLTEPAADLATLALDLGFASHSHFDVRFRRAFGRSPSAVRTLFRGHGSDQMRTLVKVLRASPT
ncbi:MAG TPA: AraC family transcriptional regulator [Candidatus Saccharimonadales bacterium]|nr:AraC family transcriptional regulator [Candidatus Saccharimonadales bacterium]